MNAQLSVCRWDELFQAGLSGTPLVVAGLDNTAPVPSYGHQQ